MALPQDPGDVGVYYALCLAHRVFGGRGKIMPHVDDAGRVDGDRPMSYPDCAQYPRQAARSAGCPGALVDAVAGHTNRGAASEAARSGLPPHETNHLAGVRDINWLIGYTRELDSDRLSASWALGL